MTSSLPFDQPGRFFRGNLHAHSTRSDGKLPPEEVIAAYRDHGYDFLALTDHFEAKYGHPIVDTRPFRTDRFTTLIGAELHAGRIEAGDRWHVLAVGLPFDFAPPAPDESGPALAARAREAGAFVAIAHPHWYGLTLADALQVESAHAVEVYNHGCHVEVDRGDSWSMADVLALHGRRLTACATDDSHFHQADYRGGWVQVRADSLDPAALLDALKAGRYYSSTGPELHDVRVEGDVLRVACSPAVSVIATGRGSRSARLHGQALTSAELPLAKFAGSYCRVTVVDASGRRAWTNPIWLEG